MTETKTTLGASIRCDGRPLFKSAQVRMCGNSDRKRELSGPAAARGGGVSVEHVLLVTYRFDAPRHLQR